MAAEILEKVEQVVVAAVGDWLAIHGFGQLEDSVIDGLDGRQVVVGLVALVAPKERASRRQRRPRQTFRSQPIQSTSAARRLFPRLDSHSSTPHTSQNVSVRVRWDLSVASSK